jgi:hypothetical protein
MGKGGARCGAGRKAIRATTTNSLTIDVRQCQRHEGLENGECGTWYLDHGRKPVNFRVSDEVAVMTHSLAAKPIQVLRVACNYGGERLYFGCPKCGGRCVLLYLRPSTGFTCRDCAGLVHPTQRMAALDRAYRRQRAIEQRLGPYLSRPLGMHLTTYDRLIMRYELAKLNAVEQLEIAWEKVRPKWVDRLQRTIARDV